MSTEPPADSAGETSEADRLSDELAKKYDPERLLRVIAKRAGRGASLDHSLRMRYERRFGVDLSHVRVYTNEFAEQFNRQRNSFAVTVGGTGVILMGGSPDRALHSAAGQSLLAHELTHVAQQARGLHFKGADGGMPTAHEMEAEQVEAEVQAEAEGGSQEQDSESTEAAANAGVNAMASEKSKEAMLESIRQRVLEMADESWRSQMMRNGGSRRP
ncbi:MAG: DUF4157 domain-containing protein [Myxococcales bacterium]|nr:DUF4157 domain-containing protein [Myxococcales bacterium]HRC57400.1 DUF4157 domain-containing protein [Kofleriaceae bacterium]